MSRARICLLVVAVIGMVACRSRSTTPASPAAVATPASTASPKHLTWATTGITWPGLPELVAQGKGFYAAQNLTVEQVVAGQSAAVCQQILARAAEIGSCNLNDMALAVEAGNAPLIQFYGGYASPLNQTVFAKPNLKSWSDLKGKTVMVGGPKDNTTYFFRIMARANGLKDNDYDFQYAGSSSARYAALKSGAVDAAIIVDPFDAMAQQAGYTKLSELVPKYANADNYGYMTATVNRDWARDHADELTRYIRAQLNAIAWLYDPAHKQEAFAIAGPKLNIDQATFDRLYQRDVIDSKFWSTTGRITDSGVQGVLNSLIELGNLKQPAPPPSKYYDMTYVNLATAGIKR